VTGWRKVITVLIAVVAVCAISHADMMPLSPPENAGSRQSPPADALVDLQPADPLAPFADFRGMADLDSPLGEFLCQPDPQPQEASETRPAQILMDRQNSLTLCLYAFFGLGLCRSALLIRKFHFGCIPDWYHNGAPSQIGHSFAISPDCLSPAPVFCFVQPESTVVIRDPLPQYRQGVVVSFWRQSQFIPTMLAPCGPPLL
jgi:hypothetical protein